MNSENARETPKKKKRVRPEGIRFTSENQPKNNGRKPSKLKQYCKDFDISFEDVTRLAKTVLQMTEAELERHLEDKKAPVFVRVLARMMLRDLTSGGPIYYYEKLLDRSIGPVLNKPVDPEDGKEKVVFILPEKK